LQDTDRYYYGRRGGRFSAIERAEKEDRDAKLAVVIRTYSGGRKSPTGCSLEAVWDESFTFLSFMILRFTFLSYFWQSGVLAAATVVVMGIEYALVLPFDTTPLKRAGIAVTCMHVCVCGYKDMGPCSESVQKPIRYGSFRVCG
jgi:hypothetical protein